MSIIWFLSAHHFVIIQTLLSLQLNDISISLMIILHISDLDIITCQSSYISATPPIFLNLPLLPRSTLCLRLISTYRLQLHFVLSVTDLGLFTCYEIIRNLTIWKTQRCIKHRILMYSQTSYKNYKICPKVITNKKQNKIENRYSLYKRASCKT